MGRVRRHSPVALASAMTLTLAAALLGGEPARAQSKGLNVNIEEICRPFAELNRRFGAPAAPGAPLGDTMQDELKISAAQYGALWSLMKLTPTPACSVIY